jgi:hypothetical protein
MGGKMARSKSKHQRRRHKIRVKRSKQTKRQKKAAQKPAHKTS